MKHKKQQNYLNITFTSVKPEAEQFKPIPASKAIPEWYKNTASYIDGKEPRFDGSTPATVKRCMPVFDSITAGYLLLLPADVRVSWKDDAPYYEWASSNLISFHPVSQAPIHPAGNGYAYPKWNNPWAIKTPKGYSTLFVQPFHRESQFTILPGVVDTDAYTSEVNFPFVLNNPKWEGTIPAGTPIAQVIPFKRDSWEMKLGGPQETIEKSKIDMFIRVKFFDRYKTLFRTPKEYR